MAKFYYNGVLLPEIPAEALAEYPYVVIVKTSNEEYIEYFGSEYYFAFSDEKYCYGTYSDGLVILGHTGTPYCLTCTYDMDSDSFVPQDELSMATIPLMENYFTLVWSNHDMDMYVDDKPTGEIYRAASDPVPFEEKKYEIKESTLKAIADSIRTKTGKTDLITPENMPSEIDGISSGGGLENGYDVMFYDENNEALAFYSIKQGHSIESPIYDCKAWQMEDGTGVSFPYTPTGDLVVYANNDTYASQLYAFYNIDPVIYPYLIITAGRGTNIMIRFGQSIGNNTTTYLLFNKVYYGSGNATISDYSDIASVVSAVTQEIPTLRYDKSYAMNSGSGWYHYQNFDSNLDDGTVKYSLA